MEFIVITGMSGAGKTRAAQVMEDMGFFVVDNLPAPLIPKFAELGMAGTGDYSRVVLVSDSRSGSDFSGLLRALDSLSEMECSYKILYMDASDDCIIKRYKESRRRHPLDEGGAELKQSIAQERYALTDLHRRADYVVDTTNLSATKAKEQIHRLFGRTGDVRDQMEVRVTSFGFKHGAAVDADLVFDVRFLPNPYYFPELRQRTGLESEVRDYVYTGGQAEEFLTHLYDLVGWLLPRYVEEGKLSLVIAVGCTGGKHRSVAMTHALAGYIENKGYKVTESHRDLGKH